jgi:hypothetical protein
MLLEPAPLEIVLTGKVQIEGRATDSGLAANLLN